MEVRRRMVLKGGSEAGGKDQGKGRKNRGCVRFSAIGNGAPRDTVLSTDQAEVSA